MIRAPEPTPADLIRRAREAERTGCWLLAAVLRDEAATAKTVKYVTPGNGRLVQNGLTN